MMEALFEFSLNLIDYTYLLFFYLMIIGQKWNWKKAISAILMISMIQYTKDHFIDFGTLTFILDKLIVIGFLYLYSEKHNINSFVYAMIFDGIFVCSVVFFVACASMLRIDIEVIRIFGIERFIFSLCTKLFTVSILLLLQKPLKLLHNALNGTVENVMLFIMGVILFIFSAIYGRAENDSNIFLYTFMIGIIMICVFYLFYKYCIVVKKKNDLEIVNYAKEVTSEHVIKVEQEYDEIKKIRHDIKNQLTIVSSLLEEENYDEAKQILKELNIDLNQKRVTISGNLYLDAVLRQKMKEYSDIVFDLDITLTKDCNIDGKDLISLFSNIIDNACEELRRIHENTFSLFVKGNSTQINIKEVNACRKDNSMVTDKNRIFHGYGLIIIEEIVNKYDGTYLIDMKDGKFSINVLLLL